MDYSKAKIYKIWNDKDDELYIGATCQSLAQRMTGHRRSRNSTKSHKMRYRLYQKMREIGVEHFYIELIKEAPCENAEQLRAIEGEYIRKYGDLNVRIEGRTKKQYTEDTKEKKAEYDKTYRENNHDYRKQQKKEHYMNTRDEQLIKRKENYQKKKENKETCPVCGTTYILWGNRKQKHLTTKTHQEALEKQPNE